MAHEFTMTRRVEFAETDMAGIMHFSNYFRFMEAAEHAFFRSLGLTVHRSDDSGMEGWARVHASCDYKAPLRYQDEVEVRVLVAEKQGKSITYLGEFRREGAVVARGRWTVVCVRKGGDGQLRSAPMPTDVDQRIDVAPDELLTGKDE